MEIAHHWVMQWVVLCPLITGNSKEAGFIRQIVIAVVVQVTLTTIAVVGGSYITLKVMQKDVEFLYRDNQIIHSEIVQLRQIDMENQKKLEAQIIHDRDEAQRRIR